MRFLTNQRLALWLWLLLVLFCIRVLAQLLQSQFSLNFLPAFDAWHSGALPYGVLLSLQALIIIVMAYTCWAFSRRLVEARRGVGIALLIAGGVYFFIMLGRILTGHFFLPTHYWFGQYLPAAFHLVLALFVLMVGGYHYSHSGRATK